MARTGKKKVWRRKPKTPAQTAAPNPGSSSVPASAVPATRVWRPGVDGLEKDEELQFDPTTYDCIHAFHLGWPCLSFDIVRDTLGALRHEFPHVVFCVSGTQADVASNNMLAVFKLSNVTGKKRSPQSRPATDDDDEESEDESESDTDDDDDEMPEPGEGSKAPKLLERFIPHQGCVNRIRAMQQQPHIVASWSDVGNVQIWDLSTHLNSLAANEMPDKRVNAHRPAHVLKKHKDEGYALDWSPLTVGRLVSGDCKSAIRLCEPTSGGKWNDESPPLLGHSASVEDLQWSPTEADVFASCSVDKTIGIWDTRTRSREISVNAHDADVNVISWNRLTPCLLASGSDDGILRIWDLRAIKEGSFVAHFKHHTSYITSIEWSPHEASTFAAGSADNQLTIWDLALERDPEEEAQFQTELGKAQAETPADLPPQLLFVHQGQKDMKELHWHSQIQGLIISTAGDGFNIFKPSNI